MISLFIIDFDDFVTEAPVKNGANRGRVMIARQFDR